MKKQIYFCFIFLLIFLKVHSQIRPDSLCLNGCKTTGFFLFIKMNSFEQVVFLPSKDAKVKYTFKNLANLHGRLITGNISYKMYNAKKNSFRQSVQIARYDKEKNINYYTNASIGILPVEIECQTLPMAKLKEETGVPFKYKGRRYVINYTDDWDVSITDIKYLK